MKAATFAKYGPPDVVEIRDVEKPAPGDNDVLVRVHASSLNAADWHLMTADIFLVRFMSGGLLKPKNTRLGSDMAGRVEAVGKSVNEFRPGEDVFANVSPYGGGALAEYVSVPKEALVPRPANRSLPEAAAVPLAAVTALQAVRDAAQVRPGQTVLINGASGGVGTFAVQIAKSAGAHVTAVCSPRNLDTARSIGADRVIDYTAEDFTRNAERYDVILGVNGYHPISAYRRALTPTGVYVMVGGRPAQIFQAMLMGRWISRAGGQRMRFLSAKASHRDLVVIRDLLETGQVSPVIDRCYPLSEIREALRYFGQGHARGKVVITIAPNPEP